MLTRISIPDWESEVLLSGSADGTIRSWDFANGTLLDSVLIDSKVENGIVKEIICCPGLGHVAVFLEGFFPIFSTRGSSLFIYTCSKGKFSRKCTLQFFAPLDSFAYSSDGQLWCSLASEESWLKCYEFNGEDYFEVDRDLNYITEDFRVTEGEKKSAHAQSLHEQVPKPINCAGIYHDRKALRIDRKRPLE